MEQMERWFRLASPFVFRLGSFSLSFTHKADFHLAIFPLMLLHSQGSNSSILFLWVTSTGDTNNSIQLFLHCWSKGSDCTDRPWHPLSKSCWEKGWELGTHITCLRLTENLLEFCVCARRPWPRQQLNRRPWTEPGCKKWRTGRAACGGLQHGSWKIPHSMLAEEQLRHLQEALKVNKDCWFTLSWKLKYMHWKGYFGSSLEVLWGSYRFFVKYNLFLNLPEFIFSSER